MNEKQAQEVAFTALAWLVGGKKHLPAFMNLTGVTVPEIRARLEDLDFLTAALDFILMEDRRVVEFCKDENLSTEVPMQARQALPGGNLPHWI